MILLTNDVERAVKILQRNYGNSELISEQLMNDVKWSKDVTNSKSFQGFSNMVEIFSTTVANLGEISHITGKEQVKVLLMKLPENIAISIGRQQEKRWGAIFTCLNSRAVHIELAHSLSTDSVTMAIRRFRGRLKKIHCDNRTNFKGAETELRRALDELDGVYLNEVFADTGMIWKFNPPAAPHFGGV
jgi:hypothetical protein